MKKFCKQIVLIASLFLATNSLFAQLTVTGTVEATTFSGTLGTNALNSITSVGTLSNLTVTGAVNAATLSGTIAVSAAAQPNITSLGQLSNLSVSGTIQGGTFSGTLSSGTLSGITSVGTLSNLTVTGAVNAATLSATITSAAAAQPNITSLGTLSNLTVTGAVNAATLSGTLSTAVQPNITTLAGVTTLTTSGTVSVGTLSATNITAATALTVTTANSLTVGGNIIPNTLTVSYFLSGTTPATSTNHSTFFIADRAYTIVAIRQSFGTASSSGTVTWTLEKLTGTQATGAGLILLNAAHLMNGTANTVVNEALTGTTANLDLAAGDRIGSRTSNNATALANLAVTVTLKAK